MAKSIYEYTDYKGFLKYVVEVQQKKRGIITEMAEAAGCHRAYLSQVIHGIAHLTPDQACHLVDFIGLDAFEGEYFQCLVDFARAGTPKLKKTIQARIDRIKKNAASLENRIPVPQLQSPEAQALYYSAWYWGAIHMLVSSPKYQTVSAIAKRLGMPSDLVHEVLNGLKGMGLVQTENQLWKFAGSNLHVARDSPLNVMNHHNWRARAILDAQRGAGDGTHYSSTFTMDLKDAEKLRQLVLSFIDQQCKMVADSGCEELFCFTCDYFKL